MRRSQIDMVHGPLLKNIIMYTVPVILTGIFQLLFNAADLIVVGRFCGSVSVAAVGATGALTSLFVNFFIGLSVGAGVCVARSIGAKDHSMVHKSVHTAILFALLGGIALTVAGITCSGLFLRWMGTDKDVIGLSTVYMQIYFGGAVPMLIYNYGAAILRAAGDTKRPLYFLSAAGVINVVLNLFFVLMFNMNVAGVALATTISQTVSAVLIVLALKKRDDACRLYIKKLHIYKEPMSQMVSIGVPAGIQGSLASISNVIVQSSVNSFGKVVMAGCAASANIENFVYVSINAFSQTSVNFVGQNMGAQNYKRLRKVLTACMGCTTVLGLFLGVSLYLFGEPLMSVYITDSPEAIAYGMQRMLLISVPYFLCGIMDSVSGCLRGVGKSMQTMMLNIAGTCGFRTLWIYTVFRLPLLHSVGGLYLSYPISWLITSTIELVYFMTVSAKILKTATTKEEPL